MYIMPAQNEHGSALHYLWACFSALMGASPEQMVRSRFDSIWAYFNPASFTDFKFMCTTNHAHMHMQAHAQQQNRQ